MKLGRELDENLGRVGRRENEEKSEGHERECAIYRPQQQGQRSDTHHSEIDTWRSLGETRSTRLANQRFRDTWRTKKRNFVEITTMSWTTLWTKGQLIEKRKIIPSPARPTGSSRAYNAGLIPEFIQKKKKRP